MSKTTSNILKSIAITVIILDHYLVSIFDISIFGLAGGAIGVGVFLFMSAYGLATSMSKNQDIRYFWIIIIRLIIIYEIATMIKVLLTIIINRGVPRGIGMEFLRLGYKSQMDGTMWYMFYIITVYLSFQIILLVTKNEFIRLCLITLCCVALAIVSHYITVSLAFPLGYLYFLLQNNKKSYNAIVLFGLAVSIFILLNDRIALPIDNYTWILWILVTFLPTIAGQIIELLVPFISNRLQSFFQAFANISFSLYLFEGFAMNNHVLTQQMRANGLWYTLLLGIVLFVISIYFTKYVVNRISYYKMKQFVVSKS